MDVHLALQKRLRQGRALIGQILLGGQEDDLAIEPLFAQACGSLNSRMAGADDDDRGGRHGFSSSLAAPFANESADVIHWRRAGSRAASSSGSSGPGSSGGIVAGSMMTPERGARTTAEALSGRGAALGLDQLAARRAGGRRERAIASPPAPSTAQRLRRRRDALVRRAPDERVERSRRRDGRPAVADDPVRHPGLVARGARRAAEPFAHGSLMAFRLLDVGHEQADAPRRSSMRRIRGDQRGDRRARGGAVVRFERRAPHGQERFGIAGRDPGKGPGAGQPILGRIAGADAQVGGGEVGMGRLRIRGLEDPRCAAIVALLRRQAPANRGRGHERRLKPAGLLRKDERALRIPLHRLFGHRGLDDRAPAIRGWLVDEPGGGVGVDRRERARPVAASRAIVQNRLTRPSGGRARIRAHRVLERRLMIAAAPRLKMQAAQAEAMRLVMIEHRVERGDGAPCVAGELRRLRLQEFGHRLVPDEPARLGGVLGRGPGVAGADRDHAARQRAGTLLALARPRGERNQRRDTEDESQHAPYDRQTRSPAPGRRRAPASAKPHIPRPARSASRRPDCWRARSDPRRPAPARRGKSTAETSRLRFKMPARAGAGAGGRPPRSHGLAPPASRPIAASRIDCSAASAACLARASVGQSPAA